MEEKRINPGTKTTTTVVMELLESATNETDRSANSSSIFSIGEDFISKW